MSGPSSSHFLSQKRIPSSASWRSSFSSSRHNSAATCIKSSRDSSERWMSHYWCWDGKSFCGKGLEGGRRPFAGNWKSVTGDVRQVYEASELGRSFWVKTLYLWRSDGRNLMMRRSFLWELCLVFPLSIRLFSWREFYRHFGRLNDQKKNNRWVAKASEGASDGMWKIWNTNIWKLVSVDLKSFSISTVLDSWRLSLLGRNFCSQTFMVRMMIQIEVSFGESYLQSRGPIFFHAVWEGI